MCNVFFEAVAVWTAPQSAVRSLAGDGFANAGFQM